jgi:hypothetical protein
MDDNILALHPLEVELTPAMLSDIARGVLPPRLSEVALNKLAAVRLEWLRSFNYYKNTPGGGANYHAQLELCEQVIGLIDRIANNQPTNH